MSPPRLPGRARKLLAAGLAAAGLVALLAGAMPDAPLSVSFSLAGKFWRAGPRSRLLNAPFFRGDAEFAAAVVAVDTRWPLGVDVALILPPPVSADAAETRRRVAGLVLAPRRVVLERAEIPDGQFRIRPLPREAP